MSADPYMERVQRRVLDLAAEVSWRDARLAEVEAAAPPKLSGLTLLDAFEEIAEAHGTRDGALSVFVGALACHCAISVQGREAWYAAVESSRLTA